MPMRDTSLAAYYKGVYSKPITHQQARVIECLDIRGEQSRQELAHNIPMAINAVCGRVKELLDAGIVTDAETKPNDETGNKVHVVKLVAP